MGLLCMLGEGKNEGGNRRCLRWVWSVAMVSKASVDTRGSCISTLSTCRFECRLPGKNLRKKWLYAAQGGFQPEKQSIMKGSDKEQSKGWLWWERKNGVEEGVTVLRRPALFRRSSAPSHHKLSVLPWEVDHRATVTVLRELGVRISGCQSWIPS